MKSTDLRLAVTISPEDGVSLEALLEAEARAPKVIEAAPGLAVLHFVFRDPLVGERRLIETLPVGASRIVGRSPSADIQLDRERVSRLHARFDHTADGVWVTDLASRNGTFVQSKRIEHVRISAGDVVTLGDVAVLVFLPPT